MSEEGHRSGLGGHGGLGSHSHQGEGTHGLGAWEKHTKGIGKKLLEKFGFKGRLGANEDGRAEIIEVKMRTVGVGLGFASQEEKESKKRKASTVSSEFGMGLEANSQMPGRANQRKTKKLKSRLSVSDLMEMSQAQSELRQEIIIDMTGKTQRLVSEVSQSSAAISQSFGEELLLKLKSSAIHLNNEVHKESYLYQTQQRQLEAINAEIAQRRAAASTKFSSKIANIQQIIDMVSGFNHEGCDARAELKSIYLTFPMEFNAFQLIEMVPVLQIKRFSAEFLSKWEPLRQPNALYDMINYWSDFFTMLSLQTSVRTGGPSQLLPEHITSSHLVALRKGIESIRNWLQLTVFPIVQRAIINEWSLSDDRSNGYCAQLILTLLSVADEEEGLVLVEDVESIFIESIIFPKLLDSIASWKVETVEKLHSALSPWLRVVKRRIGTAFPDIRQKLFKFIQSDRTGSDVESRILQSLRHFDLLKPWKQVFDETAFENLVVKSVLPRLVSLAKDDLIIDPSNQSLDCFNAIMVWSELLPHHHLVALLRGEFFPSWLRVLMKWLVQADGVTVLKDVKLWYCGWKSQFPTTLLESPLIIQAWNIALDAIVIARNGFEGQSANRGDIKAQLKCLYPLPHESYFYFLELMGLGSLHDKSKPFETGQHRPHEQGSLKEMIATTAMNRNIEYSIEIGKQHEGKAVWRLGKSVLLYIEKDVVYARKIGQSDYQPTALQDLFVM